MLVPSQPPSSGDDVSLVAADPDLRVGAGAGDTDSEFGAGAVFGKERVDRFEQDGFPAGHHLRYVRIEAGGAMEIQGLPVQVIDSAESDGCAGDIVVEPSEREMPVDKEEVAAHLAGNIRGGGGPDVTGLQRIRLLFGFASLALPAQAQLIDLLLNSGAGEVQAVGNEGTLQADSVDDRVRAGWQEQIGVKAQAAIHQRRLAIRSKVEDILNPTWADSNIELDLMTRIAGGVANHFSVRQDVRLAKPRIDRAEEGVAAGAVHNGMKGGVQRQGMTGRVEAEIWRLCFAVHLDLIQAADIGTGRGERAADAVELVQVGMAERVGAVHGRFTWAFLLERAEVTAGIDVADRFRVDH